MNKPKFSVALCVYKNDKPEWFEQALHSIIEQTLKPDEIVLVVDGPVDGLLEAVIRRHEMLLSNFRVLRLPRNMGHGIARKIGIENCLNELIALMDSDDLSLPNRFEKQCTEFSKDPELAVLGAQIAEFKNEANNIIGIRKVPLTDIEIKNYLKFRCPFNQVTVMFRKSSVLNAGGFLDWFSNEDYFLWIRMMLKNCKFANLPEVLVKVRVDENLYSRRGGRRYFASEAKLQKYMYANRIISYSQCFYNIAIRLLVQIIMPNWLRAFVFKTLFRNRNKS